MVGSASHIARDAPRRGGALFDSSAAAGSENNRRGAGSVVNCEREKKFAVNRDLFFNQHRFNGKLSDFHFQHARGMATSNIRLFRESDAADAGSPSGPGLNFNHDFAAFLVQEFLGHRYRFISSRGGAPARNFESVLRENGLTLVFVQSRHGSVLFPMKTPNLQRSTSNSENFREQASNSEVLN